MTAEGLDELGIEVDHFFPSPGCKTYIKRYRFTRVGAQIGIHSHTRTHYSAVAQGAVLLQVGEVTESHDAGAVVDVPEGVQHVVTALEVPATWLCIHGVDEDEVDERDPDRLDALTRDEG